MSRVERPQSDRELAVVYGAHPVLELVRSRPREVERIWIANDAPVSSGRSLKLARAAGIPISRVPREVLARRVGRRAVHQGVAAQVAGFRYADPEELCRTATAQAHAMLVWVDGVTDSGNLGAILRSSAAAGVAGVILSTDGTVGLSGAVAKASAGTLELVPVARDARPARRIEALQDAGFSAYALDPGSETSWDEVPLTGRIIIVAGGEEKGPRPGLIRACQGRLGIPLARGVESLNVAVAVGVLLFEAVRQRRSSLAGS